MRSAFLLGFLALSGCASAPGYRSPAVEVPASFREMGDSNRSSVAVASGDAVPASYLAPAARGARGGSPDPSDRPVLSSDYWAPLGDTTLSRLIGAGQGANLDVRGAGARVSAAHSDRVRQVLELTPSTVISGSYSRQRLSSATFPGAGVV